ncbi:thioredoxin-domain-containing protein [Fistulina hepatica ATCC 64428]|uniref:Thioredoxin-domain-containing protein n=1 Tax=Fistulina hepatica ATCC 64428 TaxID=1128425 RepID=A0A0D7AJH8_9AGAR|nr:thioredoxin-domain-containing protein [Fistulina hepatica ATCC 64428]
MQFFTIAAFVAVFAFSSALPVQTESLTPENFKLITEHGVWFIEYFSPYCAHCRAFAPDWETLGEEVSQEDKLPKVHMAQVDCAVHGDLCESHDVKGYPTMRLYRDGTFVEQFKGSRSMERLHAFLNFRRGDPYPEDKPAEPEPAPAPPEVTAPPPLNLDGEVLALSQDTFLNTIAQGPAFVKFYAPWCAHCKTLAPMWKELAKAMQGKVTIAEVDCEAHGALCKSYKVKGYPTLQYFNKIDTRTEYTGARTLEKLIAFVDQASAPLLQTVTPEELDAVVRENEVVYLALLHSVDGGVGRTVRRSAARLLGTPRVYTSSSEALRTHYGVPHSAKWAVLAFKDRNSREPTAAFYGTATSAATPQEKSALIEWMFANRLPLSAELTPDNFDMVMNAPHSPLVVIAAVDSNQKDRVSTVMSEAALAWRARTSGTGRAGATSVDDPHGRGVVFTWMDARRWGDWLWRMYGIKAGDDIPVIIANHQDLLYYNTDPHGSPITLSTTSLFSAIEAAADGTTTPRSSQSSIEKLAKSLNDKLMAIEDFVTELFKSTIFYIVVVGVILFLLIKRYVLDVPVDPYPMRSKEGRID